MKIEFCCEEMEILLDAGRLWVCKGGVQVSRDIQKKHFPNSPQGFVNDEPCPYCGAKIEITVRNDRP